MTSRILATGGAMALAASISLAADINVPGDQPTINAAIQAANIVGGDRVVVATGQYTENVVVDRDVEIIAAPGATVEVFVPAGALPGVQVSDGVTVVLDGLVLDGINNDPEDLFGETADTLKFGDAVNVTVRNCLFRNASESHIQDTEPATAGITLLVEDTVMIDGIDDSVAVREGNTAASNTVTLRRVRIENTSSDMVLLEPINLTALIEDCTLINQDDGEALQFGPLNGSITVTGCRIFDIQDSGIEFDNNDAAGAVDIVIENNTINICATGLLIDEFGALNSMVFRYNIIANWDEALNVGGTAKKGWAASDAGGVQRFSEDFNVFVDNSASYRFFVGAGAGTATGNDLAAVLCNFSDPSDADFFRLGPASPALDIDGLGRNAGASAETCSASVDNWEMMAF